MRDGSSPARAAPSPYLIVRAGDEFYALPGDCVREVTRWRSPTPVPGAPPVILGIISQRGVILPVVDLRIALHLPATPPERSSRFVVAHHGAIELALLVDAVLDFIPLADEELTLPPAALAPDRARLLSAVTRYENRPLGILNFGALITAVQEGL